MSNVDEPELDSDSDDEDYVPEGGAESEGDDGVDEKEEEVDEEEAERKKEDNKKKSDLLWAEFQKDVGETDSKPVTTSSQANGSTKDTKKEQVKPSSSSEQKSEGKVAVTKIFDFAGEEVKVTKEVDANSDEAKKAQNPEAPPKPRVGLPVKRPLGGGLAGIMSQISGKKKKMSVLEKSKLDWMGYKKDTGIEEQVEQYKKSKDGFLERRDFLERTDLRQFEIEKGLRQASRRSNH